MLADSEDDIARPSPRASWTALHWANMRSLFWKTRLQLAIRGTVRCAYPFLGICTSVTPCWSATTGGTG